MIPRVDLRPTGPPYLQPIPPYSHQPCPPSTTLPPLASLCGLNRHTALLGTRRLYLETFSHAHLPTPPPTHPSRQPPALSAQPPLLPPTQPSSPTCPLPLQPPPSPVGERPTGPSYLQPIPPYSQQHYPPSTHPQTPKPIQPASHQPNPLSTSLLENRLPAKICKGLLVSASAGKGSPSEWLQARVSGCKDRRGLPRAVKGWGVLKRTGEGRQGKSSRMSP